MRLELRIDRHESLVQVGLLELCKSLGDRRRRLPWVKSVGRLEISLPAFKLPQLDEQDSAGNVERVIFGLLLDPCVDHVHADLKRFVFEG